MKQHEKAAFKASLEEGLLNMEKINFDDAFHLFKLLFDERNINSGNIQAAEEWVEKLYTSWVRARYGSEIRKPL